MLLLDVCIETVRYCIEIIFAHPADETFGFEVLLDTVQLVTELTKGINNQTCFS